MAGIYIHIPFCKKACHYCNFHFSTSLQQRDKLIDSIVQEIGISPVLSDNIGSSNEKEQVSSIYFGGGTPSILHTHELEMIMNALQKRFEFGAETEVTLEANPDDISNEKLDQWLKLGINRLSLGVQSFSDAELEWMNRAHQASDSLMSIKRIKNAGFSNFSIDLMYGSPVLSDADWEQHVHTVIDNEIPHISCYALTVEPKTALEKMIAQHKKEQVDPEKQARQFLLLMDWLEEAGYEHYEISNFARPGFRSRHNSSYWSGNSYYGFGPAAHAFDGRTRKWNVANNAAYIQSIQKGIIPAEEEILTPTQQLNEYIMTSLRTREGIKLDFISEKFGTDKKDRLTTASKKYLLAGKLQVSEQNIELTNTGKLFADGIAADLFFE